MHTKFFKFAWHYCFRNLWRNKRRSIITLITIGFAFGISLVAARFAAAMMDLWKEGAADTGTAHIQVHKQGFFQKQEGVDENFALKVGNDFEIALDKRPVGEIEASVRRLKFEGLIATDEHSAYFVGLGVEAKNETKVSPKLFVPGNDQGVFVQSKNPLSANIGEGLAKALNLKLGDSATLVAKTAEGSVNAVDIVVDGIIDVPLPSFSKRIVYLNLAQAQKLLRLQDRYNELAIRLHKDADTSRWQKEMQAPAQNAGAELQNLLQVDPFIAKIEDVWHVVAGLLCVLMAISAVLTVINVIFMMVNERISEIGTLMAIGAKKQRIRLLFGIEGAFIGLLGGGLGFAVGNLVIAFMGNSGVPIESPFGGGEFFIYPKIDLSWSVMGWLLTILVGVLCAIPPASKAASVEPVQAFRNQI